MRHLKSALFAVGVGLFAASAAFAAEDCCKDKTKPCCEEKDGKKAACCDKHKDHGGAPEAPKPAQPQPQPHNH